MLSRIAMDFINIPLFAAGALVFLSVLSGLVSTRVGFSFLLVFLVAGMLAGEDGPGGLRFDDFVLSFWVANVSLAVILLDGGLRTGYPTFRTGLKPATGLATAGVALSAAITGMAGMWLLDLEWPMALLLGAIVGSTDAAAVFSLLKSSGVSLNERVAATLEIESGMNDPMAVYLTLAMIAWVKASLGGEDLGLTGLLALMVQQFGWGAVVGLGGGFALSWLLPRLAARTELRAGPLALLLVSAGLAVFSASGWLGGSGFLAVYLFGLVVGNRSAALVRDALWAMDGYAWLSQAAMFLLLGLLVTPSQMLQTLWPALGVSVVLMVVARPLAVWLCLAPFRFRAREVWFVSWVGLRGAVPIVLAVFPVMAGVPGAALFFNVAFVVVLTSLLLQGTTIAYAARKLHVALPGKGEERLARAVYGDFVLDARMPVGEVCAFYGLPAPERGHEPLGRWLAQELGRPPVVGDMLVLGPAHLSVREMNGPDIRAVGLRFLQPLADSGD